MDFKEFRNTEARKYLPIVAVVFVIFVLCILFFFLIFRFAQVQRGVSQVIQILMPFFYGGVFAYLLRPMCKYFERNLRARLRPAMKDRRRADGLANALSVTLSVVLVLAAVFVLITMTAQSVANSIFDLVSVLPQYIADLTAWLENIFAGNEVALNYIHTVTGSVNTWAETFFGEELLPNLQEILGGVSAGAMTIMTHLVNLLIGLIVAIYLLFSREKWKIQLKMVLHSLLKDKAYDVLAAELRFVDRTFTDYISGRILDSVIVGVIVYVACLIMGIPDAAPHRGGQRPDEHHPLFRPLYRRHSLGAADLYGRPGQMRVVHHFHGDPAAGGRQYHLSQDPQRQGGAEQLLGAVFHAALRRAVRLCGAPGGRAGVRGGLRSAEKADLLGPAPPGTRRTGAGV